MNTRLLKHGAIGLAVMIAVGLVPMVNALASVVGGGAAGYLQKGTVKDGALAGTVTGLLWTVVTLVLLVVVVVGAGLTAPPGVGPLDWLPAAGGGAFIVVLFLLVNGVVVVTAAVGGALGSFLANEGRTADAPEQAEL